MEDTEIRGFHILKSHAFMTIEAIANRDEHLYENGETFQICRKRLSHEVFGNSPHFCLGTHVAHREVPHVMLPFFSIDLRISTHPICINFYGAILASLA